MLLQNSADIHERDDEGQTPLVRVTSKGFPLMHLLSEYGVKITELRRTDLGTLYRQ
jgi:hypothetical protein